MRLVCWWKKRNWREASDGLYSLSQHTSYVRWNLFCHCATIQFRLQSKKKSKTTVTSLTEKRMMNMFRRVLFLWPVQFPIRSKLDLNVSRFERIWLCSCFTQAEVFLIRLELWSHCFASFWLHDWFDRSFGWLTLVRFLFGAEAIHLLLDRKRNLAVKPLYDSRHLLNRLVEPGWAEQQSAAAQSWREIHWNVLSRSILLRPNFKTPKQAIKFLDQIIIT